MGLRETMNNNPAAVTGGAVVILVLCLLLVYCRFMGGGASGDYIITYYDVANKQVKLVTVDVGGGDVVTSPLEGSPDVYEAAIFACGECPEGAIKDGMSLEDLESAGLFIGYLTRVNPSSNPNSFEESSEYSTAEGKTWFPISNPNSTKLQNYPWDKCGDQSATQCIVDSK